MENLMSQHGGNLDAIEREYGIDKEEIWDFSGNINPLGFPMTVRSLLARNIELVTTYPDKNYVALKKSISAYTGADSKHIVVGNGSTELISTFIQTVNAKKAIIIGPAYSEYERELQLAGSDFSYFALKEEDGFMIDLSSLLCAITPALDLLVICNPNNPTGTAVTVQQMEELVMHCKKNGTSVMVDETYIEFSDNLNEICSIGLTAKFDNLFVIRGISKFFAAPGLRLGYGISSSKKYLETLIQKQDPWSVNSLAAFAGEHLFQQTDFIEKTRAFISSERRKALHEILNWKNAKAYSSSSNFILVKLLSHEMYSSVIFQNLIQKKLLIRNASSFTFLDDSYLRFCLLGREQNELLLMELKKIIES